MKTNQDHWQEIGGLHEELEMAALEHRLNIEHFFELGTAYFARYQTTLEESACAKAVKYYKMGLEQHPMDKDLHAPLLNNLGIALETRYKQSGDMKDLEQAIVWHQQALDLCPPGHPDCCYPLLNLGNALQARYQQLGERTDLEKTIVCHQQALDLCPPGHPDRSSSLNNLGIALETGYKHLGNIEDLQQAITYHQQALNLRPLGHHKRSSSLTNLGNALMARYEQLGEMKDLEETIVCHQQALDLHPPNGPNHSIILSSLGVALEFRYKQLGDMKDLEMTIVCYQQALDLCPPGAPFHSSSLGNLGLALQTRYEQLGDMNDLEQATVCHQQALDLCQPGHPDHSTFLSNSGSGYSMRYRQLGDMKNLEQAIVYYQQALDFCPPGHTLCSRYSNNLGGELYRRYSQLGDMKDLEQSILCHQQALDLRPPGHPNHSSSLNNLGLALKTRYEQLGDMKDLGQTIKCHQQALDLCPPGHRLHSQSLNNLGNALYAKYGQLKDMEDLEQTIVCHQQALDLRPPGHPHRSSSLNGLGNALKTRYEQLRDMKDLEQSIAYHQEALDLHPPGNPHRSILFHNLALAFSSKFLRFGSAPDAICATELFNDALLSLPPHHPDHASFLISQALFIYDVHQSLWVECTDFSHIHDACVLFESATNHVPSGMLQRFKASERWVQCAHNYNHKSAISAYLKALELQQQHLALLPTLSHQKKFIESSPTLALNAASCAIAAGDIQAAVIFLEQGRSILWSKMQGYRHPLEELSKQHPDLAKDFTVVSHRLEHNAISNDVDIGLQRVLSEQWTQLLHQIRELEGFSDFLQVVPFSTLKNAAAEGPIIMVNVSDHQSNAIILLPSSSSVVIALPDVSSDTLKQLVPMADEATNGLPKGSVATLRILWDIIVQPVVNQLSVLNVSHNSRIWWCPTSYLCALPLHAAGPCKKGLKNLPDLYISSYTSTLASLIHARSTIAKPQGSLGLLLISQPGGLPKVLEEVDIIKGFGQHMTITSFTGADAHKEAALLALQSHSWVHFACHGILEEQPFDSWFQLYNHEHLSVLDLAKTQLHNAEFAFFSACHAAAGDIHGTPDESIHLAAALQFSGFRNVIGTLWAMVDDDGPVIAHAFYTHMFRNGAGTVNLRDAAEALNVATRKLRQKKVSPSQWINFIHIGV
jgi:tetratricopeptide (TPR) repeat protein/CHAT domain-containing protein